MRIFIFCFLFCNFFLVGNLTITCALNPIDGSEYNLGPDVINVQDKRFIQSKSVQKKIPVLHEWCLKNKKCASLYDQHIHKNITLFSAMSSGVDTDSPNLDDPLNSLCGRDEADVLEQMWVSKLIIHALDLDIRCDDKHRVVIDPVNLKMNCVCRENAYCLESIHDQHGFTVMLIVIIVLVSLILIGVIYRVVVITLLFKKIMSKNHKENIMLKISEK